MRVELNGESATLPARATIADAVAASGAPGAPRGVAVAVDGEVVPRAEWERFELSDGQRIEVLAAIQGGGR
jgi:sulfur carrier protein